MVVALVVVALTLAGPGSASFDHPQLSSIQPPDPGSANWVVQHRFQGWLELPLISHASPYGADIAVDWQGNRWLAWNTWQDLRLRKIGPSGLFLWRDPITINPAPGQPRAPQVHATSPGTLLVWSDQIGDSPHLVYQRLDDNGTPLQPDPNQLDVDAALALRTAFASALDAQGNPAAAWLDNRQGELDVFAQRQDDQGQPLWPDDVQVNEPGDWLAIQDVWSVAVGPANLPAGCGEAGCLYVAWTDSSSQPGGYGTMGVVQAITTAGDRLWAEPLPISTAKHATGGGNNYASSLAVDDAGRLFVAWEEWRSGDPYRSIWAQVIDTDGQRLWPADVRVDDGQEHARSPAIGLDGAGAPAVAWIGGVGPEPRPCAQRLDLSGQARWPEAACLSPTRRPEFSGDVTAMRMATHGSNLALTWRQEYADIYGELRLYELLYNGFDGGGTPLLPASVRVNAGDGAAVQQDPVLLPGPDEQVILTWCDDRSGRLGHYAQAVDGDGTLRWPGDRPVHSGAKHCGPQEQQVSFASDSAGSLLVAWREGWDGAIYAQKYDPSGQAAWSEPITVTAEPGTKTLPLLEPGPYGSAWVSWIRRLGPGAGNWQVEAQRIGPDGALLWPAAVQVNVTDPLLAAGELALAGVQDDLLLAWPVYGPPHRILAQRLGPGGSRRWAEDVALVEASTPSPPAHPVLRADAAGNVRLVWQDFRQGRGLIYAQSFDPDGRPLWTDDVRVSLEGSSGWENEPAASVDQAGNLLVAWTNYRSGDNLVYVQKLDAGGTPAWQHDLVANAGPTHTSWAQPSMLAAADGGFWVSWLGDSAGKNVYLRRFGADGMPLWADDLPVVWPDRFYAASQTFRSPPLNVPGYPANYAIIELLAELQGGSLDLWLSNDGGQNWQRAVPGRPLAFAGAGDDVRWRIDMTAGPDLRHSPVITQVLTTWSNLSLPAPPLRYLPLLLAN